MGMSNAERQRKFRLLRDADASRRREYLQKCKNKYREDKALGKKKNVKDMTEREKRSARKKWRIKKRIARQKKKEIQESLMTPPSSPENNERSPSSRQIQQSKKRKGKEVAKCYRDNKGKDLEIRDLQRKVEMYKKRWQREKMNKESPRTKTRKLLRNFSKKNVKRTLFTYNVLVQQLKQKYEEEKKKDKIRFVRNISGAVFKKYRLKTETFKLLGISISRKRCNERTCLTRRVCEKVKKFYLREDNSRVIPGLKKTVTKGKKKMQRHILCDSLINLHQKFLSEGKTQISYTLFCRLRPFWVLFPSDTDRNTCLCKTCDNIEMMVLALYKSDIISCGKIENILKDKVCDVKKYECMYGLCKTCNSKILTRNGKNFSQEVSWFEWKTKSEKRTMKDDKQKEITFTVKETITDSGEELFKKFSVALESYMKHEYNRWAQYKYFKDKRDNLLDHECLIHVDFSENYVCKMSQEIQSMHFGASKRQISLHTGVIYVGQSKGITFCSVSESLNHGPSAIWAHMKKILIDVRKQNPDIVSVEFFSDGPTTQYRQKANFFLLSTQPKEMGFTAAKWSFFESGHGKGTPDAVGGSIKREADRKVKYGEDITSAEVFVEKVKGGKTKVILVTEKEIEIEQEKLEQNNIKPIPGTLKLHQIIVNGPGTVAFRNLSCTCESYCSLCQQTLKQADLINPKLKKDTNKRKLINKEIGPKRKKYKNQMNEKVDSETIDEINRTTDQSNKSFSSSVPEAVNIESKETVNNEDNQSHTIQLSERNEIFSRLLTELSLNRTYTALKRKCEKIPLDTYTFTSQNVAFSSHPELEPDFNAVDFMPDDIPIVQELCPCIVKADGNCLPSCGSVFAFGEVDSVTEIRVRIITELVKNEKKYLDDKHLNDGVEDSCGRARNDKLSMNYAQYSETYLPGTKLNKNKIQNLYRKEVMSLTQDKSFMGIWQIHALATILNVPIYSVYPKLGNKSVRKDLNRLIVPLQYDSEREQEPVFILWSSNRDDMTGEHWVPNHFVPLLPILSDEDTVDDDLTNECTVTRESKQEEVVMLTAENADDENEQNLDFDSKQQDKRDKYETSAHMNKIENLPDNTEENCKTQEVKNKTDEMSNDTYQDKLKNDENNNFITIFVQENTSGGYDISFDNKTSKESQEQDEKYACKGMRETNESTNLPIFTDSQMSEDGNDTVLIPEPAVHETTEAANDKNERIKTYDKVVIEDQEPGQSSCKPVVTYDLVFPNESVDIGVETIDNENQNKIDCTGETEVTIESEVSDHNGPSHISKVMSEHTSSEDKNSTNLINESVTEHVKVVFECQTPTKETERLENPEHFKQTELTQKDALHEKPNQTDFRNKPVKTRKQVVTEDQQPRTSSHGLEMTHEQVESTEFTLNDQTFTEETNETEVMNVHYVSANSEHKQIREEVLVSNESELPKDETSSEMSAKHEHDAYEDKNTSEVTAVFENTPNELITDITDLRSCVGKYVIIKYNERPYPGIVEEAGETSLFVTCMKKAGKRNDNLFTWPQRVKDQNWYYTENIIGFIPGPEVVTGSSTRYKINENIWSYLSHDIMKM